MIPVLAALLICALFTLFTLLIPPAPLPVVILADGGEYRTETRLKTVAELLAEMGIALREGDLVIPEPQTPLTADMRIQVERSRGVTVTVDGQSRLYRTHSANPQDILNSAGITIQDSDQIIIDGSPAQRAELAQWPVPPTHILIQRAVTIHITDGTQTLDFVTTADTLAEALFDAGIQLYLADEVQPAASTSLYDGLEVVIHRSQPVSIIADGVTLATRVRGTTVGEALAEAGFTLIGLDYTVPGVDVLLRPGVYIRVIRVTEEVITEEQTLPFETLYQADPSLELDQTAVLQNGQPGLIQTTIRVRYENGVEISRVTEDTVQAREPLNTIIGYGTNIVLRTVDTPDGPRQYWRRIRMYATSYHPAALGGDNITATGEILRKGIVGSDPGIIAYGSEVYVPGYGIGKMADTGALRRRLRIDLGYSDADWVSWSRAVDVYLLAPVPERIEYLLPDE